MSKMLDLADQKFGDLLVREFAGYNKHKHKLWLCECTCGNTVKTTTQQLRAGLKTNCGCKSKKKLKEIKSVNELDSFLTLLSDQKINV